MEKLTFLGVWMTPDVGETVSFVLSNDDRNILIDCGTNLVRSLISSKIEPTSITDIFVTHSHGDHISGLPTYLFYRLLIAPGIFGKKPSPLQIIGTSDTLDEVKKYIRAAYGNMADNPAITYTSVRANDAISIGNVELSLFQAKHQPETLGFSTTINNKHIVYSADTGLSEDIICKAKNADILIHDVVGTSKYSFLSGAHTICKDISPLLSKYNVKAFYPVHRLSIYSDNIADYYNELASCYEGDIIIPNDGDVVVL